MLAKLLPLIVLVLLIPAESSDGTYTGTVHETNLTVISLTAACTQALPQWPNTVSVGTKPMQAVGSEKPRGSRMGRAVAAVRQRTMGSQPQLGDHVQALWTGYKSVTRPDQQLLDRSPLPALLHAVWLACMAVACTRKPSMLDSVTI